MQDYMCVGERRIKVYYKNILFIRSRDGYASVGYLDYRNTLVEDRRYPIRSVVKLLDENPIPDDLFLLRRGFYINLRFFHEKIREKIVLKSGDQRYAFTLSRSSELIFRKEIEKKLK